VRMDVERHVVTVDGELRIEALAAQQLDEAVADRGLVLDDQYAGGSPVTGLTVAELAGG